MTTVGGGGRGHAALDRVAFLTWELGVTRFALSERNWASGAEREPCALSTEPHCRGAPHLITNALSLRDKTLKALSFWQPEVCENREREQQES